MTLAGLAALLALASVLRWSHQPALRRVAAGPPAAADPRLLIRPRTLTHTARVGGLALTLTASPLVPGSNHFAVTLVGAGRPPADAQVRLVAAMTDMAMRPLVFRARPVGPGRYEATGALGMFGQWRVTAQVSRPGAVSLEQPFGLSLDLPAGILRATGSGDGVSARGGEIQTNAPGTALARACSAATWRRRSPRGGRSRWRPATRGAPPPLVPQNASRLDAASSARCRAGSPVERDQLPASTRWP